MNLQDHLTQHKQLGFTLDPSEYYLRDGSLPLTGDMNANSKTINNAILASPTINTPTISSPVVTAGTFTNGTYTGGNFTSAALHQPTIGSGVFWDGTFESAALSSSAFDFGTVLQSLLTECFIFSGLATQLILTSPGIESPVFSDFTFATHDHSSNARGGTMDHGTAHRAASLLDDDHTQYARLGGRSTSQTLMGGQTNGGDLILQSTSHSGRGTIFLGASSGYDELNIRLGLGTSTPSTTLHLLYGSPTVGNVRLANTGGIAFTSGIDFYTATSAHRGFVGWRGTSSAAPATTGMHLTNYDNSPLYLDTNGLTKVTIDGNSSLVTLAATLDVTNNDGSWTTAGWAPGVRFPSNGYVLMWNEDQTTISRGIGFTGDGNMYFIRSTADDASAAATYDMVLSAVGDLAIGAGAAGTRRLEVHDNAVSDYVAYFFNDGNNANRVGIAVQCGEDSPAGTNVFFEALEGDGAVTGRLQTTGAGTFALADVSDVHMKKNVTPSKVDAMSVINGIETIEFNRFKGEYLYRKVDCGFSAQQLREVCPDAVTEYADGTLGVMRTELIPMMVKAIQEQHATIQSLEARIALLENPI